MTKLLFLIMDTRRRKILIHIEFHLMMKILHIYLLILLMDTFLMIFLTARHYLGWWWPRSPMPYQWLQFIITGVTPRLLLTTDMTSLGPNKWNIVPSSACLLPMRLSVLTVRTPHWQSFQHYATCGKHGTGLNGDNLMGKQGEVDRPSTRQGVGWYSNIEGFMEENMALIDCHCDYRSTK